MPSGDRDSLDEKYPLFDQKRTLKPYPYSSKSKFHDFFSGLALGDEKFDAWSDKQLVSVVHGGDVTETEIEPTWVDFAAVLRGQAVFQKYEAAFLLSLLMCLLRGYIVGRFSDVLILAGYSKSQKETYVRFLHTADHVRKWMTADLSNPSSAGRKSITLVRCLHAFARRKATSVWEKAKKEGDDGIGVPLSQFDMAQVLLAFGPISLDAAENELGGVLTYQERTDYIHLWRFIGYHLGIHDEYNSCGSLELSTTLRDEFYASVPAYSHSLRPSTQEMVDSTIGGFGTHLGIGQTVLWSSLKYSSLKRYYLKKNGDTFIRPNGVSQSAILFLHFFAYLQRFYLIHSVNNYIIRNAHYSSLQLHTPSKTKNFITKVKEQIQVYHLQLLVFYFEILWKCSDLILFNRTSQAFICLLFIFWKIYGKRRF